MKLPKSHEDQIEIKFDGECFYLTWASGHSSVILPENERSWEEWTGWLAHWVQHEQPQLREWYEWVTS